MTDNLEREGKTDKHATTLNEGKVTSSYVLQCYTLMSFVVLTDLLSSLVLFFRFPQPLELIRRQLLHVDFARNKITSIPSYGFPVLLSLDLSSNFLMTLPDVDMPFLTHLNLDNNLITKVDENFSQYEVRPFFVISTLLSWKHL